MKRNWLAGRTVLVLATIVTAACAPSPGAGPTSPDVPTVETRPDTAEPTTTSNSIVPHTIPPLTYEARECGTGSVPVGYAVLCDAYQRLLIEYVDPIDPEALAAAAVLGMRSIDRGEPGESPTGPVSCYIPDVAFEIVCAELVDRLASSNESTEHLVKAAVSGMFRYGLDPFSVYVPDQGPLPDSLLSGFIYDLGMVVAARDSSDEVCSPIGDECLLRVVSVFDFTPADEAGIRMGDAVSAVDDRTLEGLAGEEAADLLVGESGEEVTLTIDRDGVESQFTLIRSDIRFAPAEFEIIDSGIAYVRLNDFSQPAAIALGSALGRPDVASAPGLILDLRDNPGGLVLAAQAVASQFLDAGEVMVEEYREGEVAIPVIDGGLATAGPEMVVLVNGASASAAEIVAAVLSERDRATVIGTSTFGKNLVQLVGASRDNGEIRITTARWKTPGGLDVGITGLMPDIVVEDDVDGDPQLEAALDLLS